MPPIKNWSRTDAPVGFFKAWEHESGEVVAITEKVPRDGYYIMAFEPDEEVRQGKGKNVGYSHLKNEVQYVAAYRLRENPEGFR